MRIFLRELRDRLARKAGYIPQRVLQSYGGALQKSIDELPIEELRKNLSKKLVKSVVFEKSASGLSVSIVCITEHGLVSFKIVDAPSNIIDSFDPVLSSIANNLSLALDVPTEYILDGEFVPEKIVAVAVHFKGKTYQLEKPYRHHHLYATMPHMDDEDEADVQGFMTNTGRFVDRVNALRIAKDARQLINPNPTYELFSEDLW